MGKEYNTNLAVVKMTPEACIQVNWLIFGFTYKKVPLDELETKVEIVWGC